MGQLGIEQDAQITERLLSEAPRGSKLAIATGYFNLTNQYMSTLIKKSQAECDILMAHPKVNTNGVMTNFCCTYQWCHLV